MRPGHKRTGAELVATRVECLTGRFGPRNPRAFTLLELLIAVAIVGILAAIAIPNFLEAQIRSKTSRVRMELAGLKLALGDYYEFFGTYPPLRRPEEEQEEKPPGKAGEFKPLDWYTNSRPGGAATGGAETQGAATEEEEQKPPVAPPPAYRPPWWGGSVSSPTWEDLHPALIPLTTPIAFVSGLPCDPFRRHPQGYGPYNYFPHLGEEGEGLLIDVPGDHGIYLFTLWSYGPDLLDTTDFTLDPPLILTYDPTNGTTSSGDLILSGP